MLLTRPLRQPVKTFDFYIKVYLKVCIFDKTFSKQAERKAPTVKHKAEKKSAHIEHLAKFRIFII